MNVLVAIIIYSIMFSVWGEEYLPAQNAKYGIMADSTAQSIGLKNGDVVTSVDGKPVERFNKIVPEIIFNEAKSVQVLRGTESVSIDIPEGTIRKIIKSQRNTFIQPRMPVVVAEVAENTEAEKMGLKAKDSIVAVNGQPISYFDEYENIKRGSAGKPIVLTVMRNNAPVELTGKVPADKVLGFAPQGPDAFFKYDKIEYGFAGALQISLDVKIILNWRQ